MAKRVGSLRDTSFIGQDPKRIGELEAQLFADFKPKDVLEEIWLSEIASLTATIEYYRRLEVSINYNFLEKRGFQTFLAEEETQAAARGTKIDRRGDLLSGTAFLRALGKFSQADLKEINTVIDVINKLRRERERMYNQFDRKRRPSLVNAVKYREVTPADDPAVQNLAD